MRGSTKVLLADDHRMIREGLRRLLEADPAIEVIGEAENGRAAVTLANELSPDVIVMDIAMPDLNGVEATRQIIADRGNGDAPKVIALSQHSDRRYSSEILKAGATGYVLKECAFEELLIAVRSAVANRVYLSPKVAGSVLEDFITDGKSESRSKLSPRERVVLQLVAEGKTTKEVAMQLQVSGKTVESHRRNLMEKLHLDSVADLTRYAIRQGITSADP
jgi:DNA-binding NarL/FixJ family response regulator